MSSPWTDILSFLGVDAEVIFSSLLLDCGVFTKIQSGKDNYFQMSGIPVSELPKVQNSKVPKAASPKTQHQLALSPGDIRFVRNRILYARPSLNSLGKVKFGLHHAHVLQRYPDAARLCHTKRVLTYIFPRQFGLHNVFTSTVDLTETAQQFKDYTLREQEINSHRKNPLTWAPRRLRGEALGLVQKIQRNHKACSYSQILRHYCPIETATPAIPAVARKQKSLSVPSSVPMSTQILSSASPRCPSWDKHDSDASFLPHATPTTRVSAFCRAVIASLLPCDAFGRSEEGQTNHNLIMQRIDEFVRMRRFESMALHQVVQSIRISSITWLACPRSQGQKMSRSDHAKRLELLNEFLYYLFDSLLIPLIRAHFYVTESSTHRNRLFYFRHDVWRKISEPSLATLKLNMYTTIRPREARRKLQSRALGYSHLRLLPKDQGSRPITNLRRRQLKVGSRRPILGSSINAQLGPLFSVLNFERVRNPAPLGSALLSVGDLHGKLANFKKKIPLESRLFFAKVDIKSCFDSIPQDQLLQMVRSLFTESSYRTTNHTELKSTDNGQPANGQTLRRRYIGSARPADDKAVFSESSVCNVASRKGHVVFADTGHHKVWSRNSLFKLLQDHVGDSIVKVGKKHMKQVDGIPQGSVLSSLLCSYFYGAFEQSELKFLDSPSSLLLRLIDDFLLVTTDDKLARQFLEVMASGDPRYGILVCTEKSLANFDVAIKGQKVPRIHGSTFFPYCGMGIEMSTLELSKDRDKKDTYIGNALTVETCLKPGRTLRRKVLASLKLQMHAMLLDMSLNSRSQVVSTLLGNFTESAMKMHQYVASLPPKRRPSQDLIRGLIEDLVSAGTKICWVKNHDKQHIRHISRAQMCWIAAAAFERVLLRKQSQYKEVLVWLRGLREGTHLRMNMEQAALERLLGENEKVFRSYVY